jgi:hypothetical protein
MIRGGARTDRVGVPAQFVQGYPYRTPKSVLFVFLECSKGAAFADAKRQEEEKLSPKKLLGSLTILRGGREQAMRENARAKGLRYLTEGCVIVNAVAGPIVRATCRGEGAVYHLGHDPGTWWCDCPARGRCAHLTALMTVTAPVSRSGGAT